MRVSQELLVKDIGQLVKGCSHLFVNRWHGW